MDVSAQEAAPSATEKPGNDDDEDKDEDTVKDSLTIKSTELLEPFCSLPSPLASTYKWTFLICSTDSRPSILSGSSSKVLTHFWTSGAGEILRLV